MNNPDSKKLSDSEKLIRIQSARQLAEIFKKTRRSRKITIEKFAQFADLSRYAIMNFEKQSTDIRLSTLLKLLKLGNIEIFVRVKQK